MERGLAVSIDGKPGFIQLHESTSVLEERGLPVARRDDKSASRVYVPQASVDAHEGKTFRKRTRLHELGLYGELAVGCDEAPQTSQLHLQRDPHEKASCL